MLSLFFPSNGNGSCVCVRECARERERVRAFVYAQHSTQTHIRARVLPHMFVLQSCSPSVCLLCMCESLNVFGGGAAAAHVHSHKFIFIHTNIQTGTHTSVSSVCSCVWEKHEKSIRRLRWCWCCTLENIIGVKGAEEEKKCEANGRKKIINSIFTHADKCTDEKSRRVKCCVWHTITLVLSEPSTFKTFQNEAKKIAYLLKKKLCFFFSSTQNVCVCTQVWSTKRLKIYRQV